MSAKVAYMIDEEIHTSFLKKKGGAQITRVNKVNTAFDLILVQWECNSNKPM
jgi:hypothetical protein